MVTVYRDPTFAGGDADGPPDGIFGKSLLRPKCRVLFRRASVLFYGGHRIAPLVRLEQRQPCRGDRGEGCDGFVVSVSCSSPGRFCGYRRHWTRTSAFAAVSCPASMRSGRPRNYNWHKVTGFWTALPLAVIVDDGCDHGVSVGQCAAFPSRAKPGAGAECGEWQTRAVTARAYTHSPPILIRHLRRRPVAWRIGKALLCACRQGSAH